MEMKVKLLDILTQVSHRLICQWVLHFQFTKAAGWHFHALQCLAKPDPDMTQVRQVKLMNMSV